MRRCLRVGLVLAMVACGLLALALVGYDETAIAFAIGLVLATIAAPVYVALALWLDRHEPEPRRTILITFFWGATIAALLALIVNSVGELIVGHELGRHAAEVYGGSISAPVVEECSKGAIIYVLYRRNRAEFDGVVDGIVYATMVGLGFAMTENILYYSHGTLQDGLPGAVGTFFARGILSPFAHPLFTAFTGIGLGIASRTTHRSVQVIAPLVGLLVAIGLHSSWNTAAASGYGAGYYLALMVPLFFIVVGFVLYARGLELRTVREQLAPEVERGTITAAELKTLGSARLRRKAARRVKKRHGRKMRNELRRYYGAATELAFVLRREARGLVASDGSDAALEQGYRRQLGELRTELLPGA